MSFADVIGASHEVDNFIIQPLLDKVSGLTALPVKVLVKNLNLWMEEYLKFKMF